MATTEHGETLALVRPDIGGWISGACADIGHLEVTRCEGGAVDLWDSRYPEDVLHVRADEFAVFLLQAKTGAFDHLVPDD